MSELCSEVVAASARQAEEKGLTLAVEVPADTTMNSDGALVRLVVQNLVGNAIKYSSRGTARVRAEQQEDGRQGAWVLWV